MTFPVVVLLFSLLCHTQAIIFEIPFSGTKCITYDFTKDDVMVGEYEILDNSQGPNDEAFEVKLVVSQADPMGASEYFDVLVRQESVQRRGKVAFTVHNTGEYSLCLESRYGFHRRTPFKFRINMKEVPVKGGPKIQTEKDKEIAAEEKEMFMQVTRLYSRLNNVRSKVTRMGTDDAMGIDVVDSLSTNLPIFSSSFLVLAILFLVVQACYLKSYWKKKRLL